MLALCCAAASAQSIAPRSPLDPAHGEEIFNNNEGQGGLRAGNFKINAAAGIAFGYDSNVYATEHAEAEPLGQAEALLRAENNSARREIALNGFVRARRYAGLDDQDTDEFGAAAHVDDWLGVQDRLTVALSGERRFESRVDIETPTNIPVSLYDDLGGELGYEHDFNRFTFNAQATTNRYLYQDSTQEYRDRTMYRGELRGAYQLRANLAWVLTGYYDRDAYDESSPTTDSADTAGALLGVHLDIRDILSFEFSGGYFQRQFDKGSGNLDGIALRGTLDWYPTRLTRIRAELSRTDDPTQIPGAFGKIRTDLFVELGHDYSRRLHLYLAGRMVLDRFDSIDQQDRLYLAELGMNLFVGEHSVLRFSYDYGERSDAAPQRDFSRHLASLSFIGHL